MEKEASKRKYDPTNLFAWGLIFAISGSIATYTVKTIHDHFNQNDQDIEKSEPQTPVVKKEKTLTL